MVGDQFDKSDVAALGELHGAQADQASRALVGAEVIEREVLRKRQMALLIFVQGWFTRNQQRKTPNGFTPRTDTIGALADKDVPGRVYARSRCREQQKLRLSQ